jgi:hypothetical protein
MALMRALERAFHDHRGALPPPIRYLVQSGRRRRQSQSLDRGGAHRLPCWRRGHDQCLASSDRPGWPLIDSPSACVAATLASLICPFVDLCLISFRRAATSALIWAPFALARSAVSPARCLGVLHRLIRVVCASCVARGSRHVQPVGGSFLRCSPVSPIGVGGAVCR